MTRKSPRSKWKITADRKKAAQHRLAAELGYVTKIHASRANPVRRKMLELAKQGIFVVEPKKGVENRKVQDGATPFWNGTPEDPGSRSGLPPTGSWAWGPLGQRLEVTGADLLNAATIHRWMEGQRARSLRGKRVSCIVRLLIRGISGYGTVKAWGMGILPDQGRGRVGLAQRVWRSLGMEPGSVVRLSGWWGLEGENLPGVKKDSLSKV